LKFDVHDEYVGKDSSNSTSFYKMLIPLINDLSLSGPVLVIESTIPMTIRLAKAIADSREEVENQVIKQLIDLVVTKLHPDHSLGAVLRKGVAYHHGSLSQEVRVAIEDAASQNHLDILVATTTMTEGVNLPVKSVVIASQGTYTTSGEYEEYITGPKLVNAIGRAGRATKETEGIVVLALNQQITPDDFKRFTPNPIAHKLR
jgi:replicative superfamily II helicase